MTARCGSQSTIRAPMPISLSTKKSRDSNIFSKTSSIPEHCVAVTMVVDMTSAGNAGQGPSSSLGTCPPRSGRMRRSWSADDREAGCRRSAAGCRAARSPSSVLRRSSGRTGSMRDLAVGDRGQADEAADLDVVGPDRVARAARAAGRPRWCRCWSRCPRSGRPSPPAPGRGPARGARTRHCAARCGPWPSPRP